MNNPIKDEPHDIPIEYDDFREEFQCCICLELLYKPVVVACGHMACFWCIFNSMETTLRESHCPVCRHPYNHFPRICKLLHFLLQKLYPAAYARREKQILEDEEKSGTMSQQLDLKSETPASAGFLDSKNIIPEETEAIVTTSSSSETNTDVQNNGWTVNQVPDGSNKELVISDLTCGICKQLLYRPVVLNCGDVCCEVCISKSSDTICKCPVCQSMHPRGFPRMCWVLEHFLEEEFPEQYAARKEWYLKDDNDQLKSSAGKASSLSSDKTPSDASTPLTGRGPKIHFYAGCDYCGMYPIVGERYRCKDCKESMGFDLCEGCYNSSCKLPGRFNQQHTEDHQFEKVDLIFRHMLARFGSELEDGSLSPEDAGDSPDTPIIILDDDDDDDYHYHYHGTSEDEEGVDSGNDLGEIM